MSMADQAKRFEILVLRPLQVLFLVGAITSLVKFTWLWLVGCTVALFYLGIVGSGLHPLQSTTGLAEGPLGGPHADIESQLLSSDARRVLASHACTKVAILIACTMGVVVWAGFGWRWYSVLLVWWLAVGITGGLLKLAFRAVPPNETAEGGAER
jgi:hypothetical protein